MENELKQIQNTALETIQSAHTIAELDQLKSQFLGKQSPLSTILKEIPTLPVEQRPVIGKKTNQIKQVLTIAIQEKHLQIEENSLEQQLAHTHTDVTLPSTHIPIGSQHPISITIDQVTALFSRLGFTIKDGPDIESDDYNFDKLNIPKDHPARDMHDTFFVNENTVLRTHTSPVQIRTMLQQKPPMRILAPGKVYRCDSDASHSPVFHQIEGLYVDKNVTFSELKGTLSFFLRELFGPNQNVRFRPSYFPFTEPSTEVDVECVQCNGNGCSLCKQTGWLEILGAGLVNRNVFRSVNIDPDIFSGFAFGMGIERIAMLKFGIPDIKLFYDNDLRFLSQF